MTEKKARQPFTLSPDKLDALRAEHGQIFTLESSEGDEIAFRKVKRPELVRFKKDGVDEGRKVHADDNLVRSVVVFPAGAEFESLLDEQPALTLTLTKAALKVSGYDDNPDVKKH